MGLLFLKQRDLHLLQKEIPNKLQQPLVKPQSQKTEIADLLYNPVLFLELVFEKATF